MFLKSIELTGFKSFASKTILDFPQGITAIVGPNGSGKSNIIDAIRWVLGERESRALRSSKTEDLIFSGAIGKARTGTAKVSLFFDNLTKFFPVDFSEVSIVRKVGRDGISQYFLNQAEIRLKDAVDFFAKSRLGTKGLSIINQGSSDVFVKSSSRERQAMIEEALGLKEFQLKKSEAEKKLKNTAFNLEKVKAMLDELSPHLKFFKKQLSRLEKKNRLESEFKDLARRYFFCRAGAVSRALDDFNSELGRFDGEIAAAREEIAAASAKLKAVEAAAPVNRKELAEVRNRKDVLAEKRAELQRELGKAEAMFEMAAGAAGGGFSSEELKRLVSEIKTNLAAALGKETLVEIKTSLKSLLKKIEDFFSGGSGREGRVLKGEFEEKKKEISAGLESISLEIKTLSEAEKKHSAGLEEYDRLLGAAYFELEEKKKRTGDLETKRNRVILEKEMRELKLDELRSQAEQFGENLDGILKTAGFDPSGFDVASAEKKIFRMRGELAAIGEVDESLLKEAGEVEARHGFLSSQLADLEKASTDLAALVEELEKKIDFEFGVSLKLINREFDRFFKLMFGGGRAELKLSKNKKAAAENGEKIENGGDEISSGIEIELGLPKKRAAGLDGLSGGEKSLVSIAALFAVISVSPPPFLVLDEIDAALDDKNAGRFASLLKEFSGKTQFLVVTHNRATMEAADVLYGITLSGDGVSRVLSLKLDA